MQLFRNLPCLSTFAAGEVAICRSLSTGPEEACFTEGERYHPNDDVLVRLRVDPAAWLMTIPGVGHLARLHGCRRRSRTLQTLSRSGGLSGSGAASLSIRRGRLHRRHLQVRRPANANPALRSCECHVDALQGTAEVEGLGVGHCQAIHFTKGADRARPTARDHYARHASARHGVQTGVTDQRRPGRRNELPGGSDARGRDG